MDKKSVLRATTFGERVAEEEGESLSSYFVETDLWHQLQAGDIDVIYGAKGSGKSALYALLYQNTDQLFDRGILLTAAENPRGATAFKDLENDPPVKEQEFIGLWKLYFACLLQGGLETYGINNESARQLRDLLSAEGLIPQKRTLKATLQGAWQYVKQLMRPKSLESALELDPITQTPRIVSRLVFLEPQPAQRQAGQHSVDDLLELANDSLVEANYRQWILLDRLDVAFADNSELEQNALRALFRVYLDLKPLESIKIKIFLRTDIWRRITSAGFRESSHITKARTIEWDRSSLLRLIIRRALANSAVQEYYGVVPTVVMASGEAQERFFYQVFPAQVESGSRKSTTLDWLLTRIRDGSGRSAPRELIHMLNELRNRQIAQMETVGDRTESRELFSRPDVFKLALQDVSRVRLQQTMYAEYPEWKDILEQLRGEKTQHSVQTLASVWAITEAEAIARANGLLELGLFELRSDGSSEVYWVPFLYRDALDLVQGAAD